MIGTIDIELNAHHPNLPLETMFAHVGSPTSVRIVDVPKKIGTWKIEKVYVTANYPDNTSQSTECVLVGGCYVGTLPASTEIGKSKNGFKVTANGTDENGNVVNGYVLGKGDIVILTDDAEVTTGKRAYYLHLKDEVGTCSHKGDVVIDDGFVKIFNGEDWLKLKIEDDEEQ